MIEFVRFRNDFGKKELIDSLWRLVVDPYDCYFKNEVYVLSLGFMNKIKGKIFLLSDFNRNPLSYL